MHAGQLRLSKAFWWPGSWAKRCWPLYSSTKTGNSLFLVKQTSLRNMRFHSTARCHSAKSTSSWAMVAPRIFPIPPRQIGRALYELVAGSEPTGSCGVHDLLVIFVHTQSHIPKHTQQWGISSTKYQSWAYIIEPYWIFFQRLKPSRLRGLKKNSLQKHTRLDLLRWKTTDLCGTANPGNLAR